MAPFTTSARVLVAVEAISFLMSMKIRLNFSRLLAIGIRSRSIKIVGELPVANDRLLVAHPDY